MQELSKRYPIWFVDIWGVVHNGVEPFEQTVATLAQHRAHGGVVILVSNSPRSSSGVTRQLDQIGVRKAAYDHAVTSGDVTQQLMRQEPSGKLFHIGAARDLSLFEGQPVQRVAPEQAGAIICTGLLHDEYETPDDYRDLLRTLVARKLPMICANPDKRARKGNTLVYCAGALAAVYEELGGTVAMAGKPYSPIYELALQTASQLREKTVMRQDVLAIGDGPETDILGAANQKFPVVYVAGGVRENTHDLAGELAQIKALVPTANIIKAVHHLSWA